MFFIQNLNLLIPRPPYRRSLQPSEKNIQHFKPWNFFTFIHFCWSLLPSWLRIQQTKINADPDSKHGTKVNLSCIPLRFSLAALRLTFKGLELWKGDAPLFGLVQNTTEQMQRFLVIILWRQKSKIPIRKDKIKFRKFPLSLGTISKYGTAYTVSTYQCCGSMTFWCGSGSGSADQCLWLMDPDPDPAIFVIHLQDANKN